MQGINEGYAKLVGKVHLMPPNPLMVVVSVDCDVYAKMLTEGKWVRTRAASNSACRDVRR